MAPWSAPSVPSAKVPTAVNASVPSTVAIAAGRTGMWVVWVGDICVLVMTTSWAGNC